jgi:hypothetical protein
MAFFGLACPLCVVLLLLFFANFVYNNAVFKEISNQHHMREHFGSTARPTYEHFGSAADCGGIPGDVKYQSLGTQKDQFIILHLITVLKALI